MIKRDISKKMLELAKYFLFIISIYSYSLNAQTNHTIDSLENLLLKQKNDTHKVNLLNILGWKYLNINPEKSIYYEQQALLLSKKLNYKTGIAVSNTHIGYYSVISGNYDEAIDYYLISLKILKNLNKKPLIATCYSNIGNVYYYKSDYKNAIKYQNQALEINKSINNRKGLANNYTSLGNVFLKLGNYPKSLNYFFYSLHIYEDLEITKKFAGCYNNIAIVYKKQKDYDNALKYYFKAIELGKKFNNNKSIAECYNNIGILYMETDENSKANDYFIISLKIFTDLNYNKGIAVVKGNLGELFINKQEYELALQYLKDALKLKEKIGDIEGMASTYNNISKTYIKLKNITLAKQYTLKSLNLSNDIGSLFQANISYKLLAQIFEIENNFSTAYYYLNLYISTSDSLFNIEKTKEIENIKNQYELDKKEAKIQTLSQQTEIQELLISRNKYLLTGVISVSVLLLLLGILFVNRQRIKNKKEKQIHLSQKALMEAEMKNINLRKNQLNTKLLYRKKEVLDLATQIIEKNNLINDIEGKIEKLKQKSNSTIVETLRDINIDLNLNKSRKNFNIQVEQLHKDFFLLLSERHSGLTKNEKKLVALLRLGLSSKDISTLMNISAKSVDMNRYRLRKKLGIGTNTNLTEYLKKI